MSNKRFRRARIEEDPHSTDALRTFIGAAVLGTVVFFATLIYDLLNPSPATASGVRAIVFAIPAAVVGAMVGSALTPRRPARRR